MKIVHLPLPFLFFFGGYNLSSLICRQLDLVRVPVSSPWPPPLAQRRDYRYQVQHVVALANAQRIVQRSGPRRR